MDRWDGLDCGWSSADQRENCISRTECIYDPCIISFKQTASIHHCQRPSLPSRFRLFANRRIGATQRDHHCSRKPRNFHLPRSVHPATDTLITVPQITLSDEKSATPSHSSPVEVGPRIRIASTDFTGSFNEEGDSRRLGTGTFSTVKEDGVTKLSDRFRGHSGE